MNSQVHKLPGGVGRGQSTAATPALATPPTLEVCRASCVSSAWRKRLTCSARSEPGSRGPQEETGWSCPPGVLLPPRYTEGRAPSLGGDKSTFSLMGIESESALKDNASWPAKHRQADRQGLNFGQALRQHC